MPEATNLAKIAEIETAFVSMWPGLETHWDGSWVWRFARGYTKRANSIQVFDPADDGDAPARLGALAARSRAAGIDPVFRQTPLAGPGVVNALDALGWSRFETSRILALDELSGSFGAAHEVEVVPARSGQWIADQCMLNGYGARTKETLSEMIALMPETSRGITIRDGNGAPAASVLAICHDGIAMFNNVVTAAHIRRSGLGRSAMGAALDAMADLGARRAAIHVVKGNVPAERLYEGLGFVEIGTYSYRKAGAP